MVKIFLENIKCTDGYETVLTVLGNPKENEKQTFRTFTYAKDGYPDTETLRHLGFHLQELGRMLVMTIQTNSLFKVKE